MAGHFYGRGQNTLERMSNDKHAPERVDNPYYPFASKQEWETARWLLLSGCSQSTVDDFFHLSYVRCAIYLTLPFILTCI